MTEEEIEVFINKEFAVKKNLIYCNNSAVAPIPVSTQNLITKFLQEYSHYGSLNYPEWINKVEKIRENFAKFLNASKDEIAFVKNTSTGLSIIANGIKWNKGDEIIILEKEFPANIYPWLNLKKQGVKINILPERNYKYDYNELLTLITNKTRLIALSFIEYSTGFKHDLEYIGKICREKDIIFVVDAIQGMGVFPIDVRKMNISVLCADGHKWMCSPEGCGIFYIEKSLIPKVEPVLIGWNTVKNASNYDKIEFTVKENAQKYEEGSLNLLGIFALGNMLNIINKISINYITQKVLKLSYLLFSKVDRNKYKILSPKDDKYRSSIVTIKPMHKNVYDIYKILEKNSIFCSVRRNALRFSIHFYNDEEEINKVVNILNKC